jgi:eukaryotic-like serine/threonine-protein kinase
MTSPLRIRGYAVGRLLGSGATSEVWAARAIPSGAAVALKRIHIVSGEQRARARSEAALLAALDNPNVVRLHTMTELDDAVVLVLDLAEGGSLARLLTARGRLTPGEVITAIAPIAAALDYLHESGVVHGDISAANILFTSNGVPLLADIGVARLTGDDRDAEASPAYVDPAVAAGCVPAAQSDLFMLAGVALHALTGAPPWPDSDPAAALSRAAAGVLDDVPARLSAAGVPEAMTRVLARALDVDPQRRGTAADLALDLAHSGTAVAVELTAGVVPEGSRAAQRAAAPPPTRMVARPRPVIARPPAPRADRRLPIALAVAVVGVLVAAAIAWKTMGTSDGHPAHPTRPPAVPAAEPPAQETPAPNWLAELKRLAAVRARAFANRQPALLRRVYVPGQLLRADQETLLRLVPPGCRLLGAQTTYSHPDVLRRGGTAVVTATAALRRSQLVCADGRRMQAAGAVARLRVQLRKTPAGVRITALRRP